jgi:tetratricopeptide (TPR) repeat protein
MFPPPELNQQRSRSHMWLQRVVVLVFVATIFPSLVSSANGQGSGRSSVGTGGTHIIQGYVFFPSGRRAEGPIHIKLESYSAGENSLTLDASGSFQFTSLAPGSYTVVVNAGDAYEITRETVFIDTDVNLSRSGIPAPSTSRRYSLMLHLQPKRQSHVRPSVIDASLAEVPDKARKLYEKALEQDRAAETLNAIDSLNAAIAIYPQFPLAANELGVQYLKLGKADKAVEALRNAIRLDPNAFNSRLNLGIALLQDKQFGQARTQLEEAVKRNASAPIPHMYMGLVLAHMDNDHQAEQEFLRAIDMGGGRIPQVHYYLGGLYWKLRDYAKAIEQLEKYLQLAPNAVDAPRVRETIRDLRKKL